MGGLRSFHGRCHCGALALELQTRQAPGAFTIRACQCSFCRRHRTRTLADPRGKVKFLAHDPQAAVRYRFGLRTADYLICSRCGVYMGAAVTEDGAGVAIVNAPVLDEHALFAQKALPVDYDHEDAAARLARRGATWTPLLGTLPGTRLVGR